MKHKRNRFDLSFPLQTTFDAGVLVPFFVQDTLPNDTFYLSAKSFIRAQPMTAPLLHDVDVFLQYFYCPERILWDKTEDFFLGIPDDTGALPVRPTVKAPVEGWAIGSLADYLGFPTGQGEIEHSAIPFRAYAAIYNEFYRDKTLQSPVSISLASALDEVTNLELQHPRWKKDYFHKSELQRQLGGGVSVPIEPMESIGEQSFYHYVIQPYFLLSDGSYKISTDSRNDIYRVQGSVGLHCPNVANVQDWVVENQDTLFQAEVGAEFDTGITYRYGRGWDGGFRWIDCKIVVRLVEKTLEAYTSQPVGQYVTPASINCRRWQDGGYVCGTQSITAAVYHSALLQNTGQLNIGNLAQATHMQRFQETMLKVDNDYSRFIKAMYGFKLRNDIIDLPQYLGGSRGEIAFSAVLQTSEGEQGGVGSMYGHGVGRAKQRPIKFRCPEHGVIIGIVSIRPKFVYSQGIDRAWSRTNRFDFFLPDFSDIGPQEVMQKELYATKDNKDIMFGYSERFAEYRSRFPKISGAFKRELADWNMAVVFSQPPSLNGDFLSMKSGLEGFKRPFAVPSEHNYLMYVYNKTTAIRAVPKFARRTTL
ncbi:MAG: major capsid protein [Microviridae sp.]|nr:MAG: major capsid protein [Microviridae sp.]